MQSHGRAGYALGRIVLAFGLSVEEAFDLGKIKRHGSERRRPNTCAHTDQGTEPSALPAHLGPEAAWPERWPEGPASGPGPTRSVGPPRGEASRQPHHMALLQINARLCPEEPRPEKGPDSRLQPQTKDEAEATATAFRAGVQAETTAPGAGRSPSLPVSPLNVKATANGTTSSFLVLGSEIPNP